MDLTGRRPKISPYYKPGSSNEVIVIDDDEEETAKGVRSALLTCGPTPSNSLASGNVDFVRRYGREGGPSTRLRFNSANTPI
jgi:hypothetical protein